MKSLNFKDVAKALNCSYEGEDFPITGVSTDTRTIEKGNLFIPIIGERMDGHDYIDKAIENGAAAVLASKEIKEEIPTIYVENTLDALINLSAYYRSLFSPKVVGVTGSVGKTSTKEMIYAALSESLNTIKTIGNRNNEIGLPHTLFTITPETEAAVIEMGMVNRGEIDVLTRAVCPDVAVITNIGVSHIENLKTRENILLAKLEIENGLVADGVMVLCADNDLLHSVKGKLKHKTIYYGIRQKADIYADEIEYGDNETSFIIHDGDKSYPAKIPTVGEHNVLNALAAFAVCKSFGLNPEASVRGLKNFESSGSRQKIYKHNGVTIIEDCYNASPDSMKAALWVLKNIKAERKIAVLGDMLELGEISEESHRAVGKTAAENADIVFTFGPLSKITAKSAEEQKVPSFHFEDKKALVSLLLETIKKGDAILFKGSRGMKLEEVIEGLLQGDKNQ
ncbi:MAG: UDP-N-acetylmuramoyl-tripeptide--D-alanyl-D-alanine ligase [Oscillospiraceae bacterium]|nr:UDP-N-acetylmuramoyl-tripeptide--D-alanyl-D-alanine ligase [Oscillospiraceae bacterium]